MANENFDEFLRKASNYTGGEPEFYEDTHDLSGNYIGNRKNGFSAPQQPYYSQPTYTAPSQQKPSMYSAPQNVQQNYNAPNYYDDRARGAEAVYRTEQSLSSKPQFAYTQPEPQQSPDKKKKAVPLPDLDQFISPRMYQNIVLYSPRTSSDVERLIDYMRRREPAIVDLDPISDSPDAQRILDFTSGAVYALGGRIIGIKSNMFLVVPEGIDVAKPEGN